MSRTDLLGTVLAGIVPPLLVSAALVLLGWARARRDEPREAALRRGWAGALAVGLGFAAGAAAVLGREEIARPVAISPKLFHLALAAAVWGAAEARATLPAALRHAARLAAASAAVWALLPFVRAHRWSPAESVLWTAVLGLAIALGWGLLDALAARRRGAALPAAFVLVAACAGGALHRAGSASLGQLAGALAAAAAPLAVLGLLRPAASLARGASAPLALVLAGLLLAGSFAAELPTASALLLALAPLAPWTAELGPSAHPHPLRAAALRLLLAAVPAVAAVGLAASSSPAPYAY